MTTTSHELIERYVGGTLTTEERRLFEQTLASDPHLAQQVRIEQSLFSAIAKDRSVLPLAGSTTPGATLLSQLAETSAQLSFAGSTATAGGKAAFLFGSPWIVNVLAGVALVGVIAGVLFIAPLVRQSETVVPTVQRDTVYVPVAPAAPVVAPLQNTGSVQEPGRRTVTVDSPADHASEQPLLQENDGPSKNDEKTLQELLEREERQAPLEVRRTDSVRLNISIEK